MTLSFSLVLRTLMYIITTFELYMPYPQGDFMFENRLDAKVCKDYRLWAYVFKNIKTNVFSLLIPIILHISGLLYKSALF